MKALNLKENQIVKVGDKFYMNLWIEETHDGIIVQDNELVEVVKVKTELQYGYMIISLYLGEYMADDEEFDMIKKQLSRV